jgi:hypothetical protein
MNKTSHEQNFALTRGGKRLIEQAIIETGSTNGTVLVNHICDTLSEKFTGDTLDYQTSRMNFTTTGDIMRAIDTYMYHQIKNETIKIQKSKIN